MEIRYVDEARFDRRQNKLGKKHSTELIQVVNNLNNALAFWEESTVELIN